MRTPMVDYRKLRLHNIHTPEYSHLKLLLGWVTANLMGFNKVDDMGEMLVSSELHSESSTGMCFLEGEGRGETDGGSCPSPCRLEAPSGKQDLPTPSTAFEPLRTFLLCSSGSHSLGHLLVEKHIPGPWSPAGMALGKLLKHLS